MAQICFSVRKLHCVPLQKLRPRGPTHPCASPSRPPPCGGCHQKRVSEENTAGPLARGLCRAQRHVKWKEEALRGLGCSLRSTDEAQANPTPAVRGPHTPTTARLHAPFGVHFGRGGARQRAHATRRPPPPVGPKKRVWGAPLSVRRSRLRYRGPRTHATRSRGGISPPSPPPLAPAVPNERGIKWSTTVSEGGRLQNGTKGGGPTGGVGVTDGPGPAAQRPWAGRPPARNATEHDANNTTTHRAFPAERPHCTYHTRTRRATARSASGSRPLGDTRAHGCPQRPLLKGLLARTSSHSCARPTHHICRARLPHYSRAFSNRNT